MEYSHSIEEGPIADLKVALFPHFIKQKKAPTAPNQMMNQMRTCT